MCSGVFFCFRRCLFIAIGKAGNVPETFVQIFAEVLQKKVIKKLLNFHYFFTQNDQNLILHSFIIFLLAFIHN